MARPRSDIQARIVQAAYHRFLAAGVDGAALREIARDAHTSIGMIYYYFPTKDELFLAVVEHVYRRLLADLEVALAPGVPAAERIAKLYARVGAMTDDELGVVRLLVREALSSSTRLERLVDRFARGHLPLVAGTVVDGVLRGELRPDLPPAVLTVATMLLAIVPQVVRRLLGSSAPFAALLPEGVELGKVMAEVLWRGIGKNPETGDRGPATGNGKPATE